MIKRNTFTIVCDIVTPMTDLVVFTTIAYKDPMINTSKTSRNERFPM